MNYVFLDRWHEFLPREVGHLVAFMGSGGKTSLMREAAAVLAGEGVRVIATTTTRTEPVAWAAPVDLRAEPDFDPGDGAGPWFVHDGVTPDGKWRGLEPDQADRLEERFGGAVVLAEVDGAAKQPLKIHRNGEPVWPGRTSLAVVVMGTPGIGCRAGEVVHRFGREPCPALADHAEWTLVEWDHAAELLLGEGGYLHRVPDGVPAVLALTGLGEQADSVGLFGFVARAMDDSRLPLVLLGETESDPPSLRTACRAEGPA